MLQTAILLAGLTAPFSGIGFALGGRQGMVIAFLVAYGTNLWAWWSSDRVVLAMHNAEPIAPESAPRISRIVHDLAQSAALTMPALYVIHENEPNAFATGQNPENAAVAVNTGLLDLMSEEETTGLVAHELAHIRHRDTLIMTIPATLAGAIGMLGQFGFLFGGQTEDGRRDHFGPIAAMLVQMCAVPECGGAFPRDQEDALWQQAFTAQPERRREFEPNSKQRKRRPAPSPPSTA